MYFTLTNFISYRRPRRASSRVNPGSAVKVGVENNSDRHSFRVWVRSVLTTSMRSQFDLPWNSDFNLAAFHLVF
jgi:hypothetical protein